MFCAVLPDFPGLQALYLASGCKKYAFRNHTLLHFHQGFSFY